MDLTKPITSAAARGKIPAAIALLRPHQWLKNGVVLAPLVFSHRLLDPHAVLLTLLAVGACCALSSAGYALNDLLDAAADRMHPVKRMRPLASGQLTPADGIVVLALCATLGIALCLSIRSEVAPYIKTLDYNWDDHRLDFRVVAMMQTITGRIEVYEDFVKVELALPRLLHLLAKSIAGRIENRAATLLEAPKGKG